MCDELKERIGVDRAEGTYSKYYYTRKIIAEFVKYKFKTEDVAFGQLTEQFIRDFQEYVTDTKGQSLQSVCHYLVLLKKACRIAFKEGYSEKHYFCHYKLPEQKKSTPKALSRVDFIKIRDLDIPERRRSLRLTRDLFLFACYTGLAYVDVKRLYPHHISETADGKKYIRKCRSKTDVEAFIPLHPVAERILSLYNTTDREQPVFPLSSRDVMWWEIHGVGVALGFKENLSHHQGQHNFGTLLISAGISIESVAKMMGHTNLTSSQIYAKITDDKISKDMDELMERRKTKNAPSESYSKKLSACEKKANNSKSIKSE